MTATTARKKVRRGTPAADAITTDLHPFPVVKGRFLFLFTPAPEGGFSVNCQNLSGVNAQGDTFEEALENAVGMAAFVEDCQREIAAEGGAKAAPIGRRRKK